MINGRSKSKRKKKAQKCHAFRHTSHQESHLNNKCNTAIKATIDGTEFNADIDTGSDITIISESNLSKIKQGKKRLKHTNIKAVGWKGERLTLKGELDAKIKIQNKNNQREGCC